MFNKRNLPNENQENLFPDYKQSEIWKKYWVILEHTLVAAIIREKTLENLMSLVSNRLKSKDINGDFENWSTSRRNHERLFFSKYGSLVINRYPSLFVPKSYISRKWCFPSPASHSIKLSVNLVKQKIRLEKRRFRIRMRVWSWTNNITIWCQPIHWTICFCSF